jgi:hypothetical protein
MSATFVLAEIIAKALVFVDSLLAIFVDDATIIAANEAGCQSSGLMAGNLTACGDSLLTSLTTVIVGGTQFLAGALQGLGVQGLY